MKRSTIAKQLVGRGAIWAVVMMVLAACTPTLKLNLVTEDSTVPATPSHAPFAFMEEATGPVLSGKLLGTLEIKNRAFTVDCEYDDVKRLATEEARRVGGNCVVVKEHQLPDYHSTCHRLKAEIWWIENPQQYEKIIVWYPARKLQMVDFKGDTLKRPFQAATATAIRYSVRTNRITGFTDLKIETLFNCETSYFKLSKDNEEVLAHEQLHFDIAEVYARKLCKNIQERCANYQAFATQQEQIYQAIEQEMMLKQDEFDSDIYEQSDRHEKWANWVQQELVATAEFQDKQLRFGH